MEPCEAKLFFLQRNIKNKKLLMKKKKVSDFSEDFEEEDENKN